MSSWREQMAGRFVNAAVRLLGPYRVWRVLHAWAAQNPEHAHRLTEYVLNAELPNKWVSEDFLSRWLTAEEVIRVMRHQSVQLDSPFYALLVFRQVLHECLAQGHIPRRVLEIGPGVHLGAAFCFAAMGMERVAVVDIARVQPDSSFYEKLFALLALAGGFQWWRYNGVVNPYREITHPNFADKRSAADVLRKIEIESPVSADAMPFADESFDLVYSINALEHFPRPQDAVKEMRRVLSADGLAVCEIDLRYHCDMRNHPPEDALKFLEWTDKQWRAMSETYAEDRALKGCLKGEWGREVFCNRIRWTEWKEIFHQAGFELLKTEPLELLAEQSLRRERFVEPFRSMPTDELAVLVGRIIARKR